MSNLTGPIILKQLDKKGYELTEYHKIGLSCEDIINISMTHYERVDGDKKLISLLDNYLEQYIADKDLIINEILKRIDIKF